MMDEIRKDLDFSKKEFELLRNEKELLEHVLEKKTDEGQTHMTLKIEHVKDELEKHY
jgi:hypothetical protein